MIAEHLAPGGDESAHDDIVVLHNATWADYLRMLKMRGDKSAPRIAFDGSELEIMSPGYNHETIKSRIGCLVEVYCLECGIDFDTVGSWTVKSRKRQRGVEPDECYVFGGKTKPKKPDLAIEVVWTSGGIDKLDIYRKLGVREVWFWENGRVSVHELVGDEYRERAKSVGLPGIALDELASFLDRPSTSAAIKAYRAALAKKKTSTR